MARLMRQNLPMRNGRFENVCRSRNLRKPSQTGKKKGNAQGCNCGEYSHFKIPCLKRRKYICGVFLSFGQKRRIEHSHTWRFCEISSEYFRAKLFSASKIENGSVSICVASSVTIGSDPCRDTDRTGPDRTGTVATFLDVA
jgi:hypothetical protein